MRTRPVDACRRRTMLHPPSNSLLLRRRRPPRSPLFPSTTLFRSVGGRAACRVAIGAIHLAPGRPGADLGADALRTGGARPDIPRSEEHTSELQSREKLVCRLLLEKKKTHIKTEEHARPPFALVTN